MEKFHLVVWTGRPNPLLRDLMPSQNPTGTSPQMATLASYQDLMPLYHHQAPTCTTSSGLNQFLLFTRDPEGEGRVATLAQRRTTLHGSPCYPCVHGCSTPGTPCCRSHHQRRTGRVIGRASVNIMHFELSMFTSSRPSYMHTLY